MSSASAARSKKDFEILSNVEIFGIEFEASLKGDAV
jgi:hypothetical protein